MYSEGVSAIKGRPNFQKLRKYNTILYEGYTFQQKKLAFFFKKN